jgi:hypothetical protein
MTLEGETRSVFVSFGYNDIANVPYGRCRNDRTEDKRSATSSQTSPGHCSCFCPGVRATLRRTEIAEHPVTAGHGGCTARDWTTVPTAGGARSSGARRSRRSAKPVALAAAGMAPNRGATAAAGTTRTRRARGSSELSRLLEGPSRRLRFLYPADPQLGALQHWFSR